MLSSARLSAVVTIGNANAALSSMSRRPLLSNVRIFTAGQSYRCGSTWRIRHRFVWVAINISRLIHYFIQNGFYTASAGKDSSV